MVTISKKTEYALMLVMFLTKNNEKGSVSLFEVSKELSLPYRFLSQMASEMKKGNLLVSKEGKGGGYKLTRDWYKYSLYDLMAMLGDNRNMVECMCKTGKCKMSSGCKLKSVWQKLELGFVNQLKQIKLVDL